MNAEMKCSKQTISFFDNITLIQATLLKYFYCLFSTMLYLYLKLLITITTIIMVMIITTKAELILAGSSP